MKPGNVLFAYGFRPFFLLAGWFAAVAIPLWAWWFASGHTWAGGLATSQWHAHEMLYGFVTAAIAGFMLTAVPSWTGTRGFGGWPLVWLALAWLAGRLVFGLAGLLPIWLVAAVELVFLPLLAALVAPPLVRSMNRNTPLLFVLAAMWIADAVFLLALYRSDSLLAAQALQFTLNLVLLLITIIGGRIVPAFTANALRARGMDVRMRSGPWLERGVIAAMIAVLLVDLLVG
ncbi:MAG TPA: NnrS family protein, partial [Xanthomonadales bacterium]|nr:NnrS family protein [Xanthomonadales bacterium]